MYSVGLLSLLLVAVSASAAVAQDVSYGFDQGTDFCKFQTDKWVTSRNGAQEEDVASRQIQFAVDQELAKKGLLKSDSDKADLYVLCQAATDTPKPLTLYDPRWHYGSRWSATSTANSDVLQPGQLAVDVYDSATKSLIWRGVVSKAIG